MCVSADKTLSPHFALPFGRLCGWKYLFGYSTKSVESYLCMGLLLCTLCVELSTVKCDYC